jgi:hypothetical protein
VGEVVRVLAGSGRGTQARAADGVKRAARVGPAL